MDKESKVIDRAFRERDEFDTLLQLLIDTEVLMEILKNRRARLVKELEANFDARNPTVQ
jgi:hypothetical protein